MHQFSISHLLRLTKMDLQKSVFSKTDVSLTLAQHVFSTYSPNSNIIFSPFSILVVLSLIAAGTKGETLSQLLTFLKSDNTEQLNALFSQLVAIVFADGNPKGGLRLSFANGLWVDHSLPLKPSFKQVVDNEYKASSTSVDFRTKALEVCKEVNLWAEKKTSGLIKEILPSDAVNCLTRLIFANALYFKGVWDQKFNMSTTKEHDFHLFNGKSVKVPFMTSKKKQFLSTYEDFKVLGLPYEQGEDKRCFTMYFFLPNTKDGLPNLVKKVDSSQFLMHHIPYRKVEVGDFLIPKFKISFGFEASKDLKKLGLVLPFSGEEGLTEMVDSPVGKELYVSSIYHKSFIEVNEEGTEAAAATAAVIMQQCSLPVMSKIDFVADHPFFFVLREDMTGVVLFMGQVVNPLAV